MDAWATCYLVGQPKDLTAPHTNQHKLTCVPIMRMSWDTAGSKAPEVMAVILRLIFRNRTECWPDFEFCSCGQCIRTLPALVATVREGFSPSSMEEKNNNQNVAMCQCRETINCTWSIFSYINFLLCKGHFFDFRRGDATNIFRSSRVLRGPSYSNRSWRPRVGANTNECVIIRPNFLASVPMVPNSSYANPCNHSALRHTI